MDTSFTAFAAIACYLSGAILIAVRLFRSPLKERSPRMLGVGLGLAGVLLHALMIYQGITSEGGINLSFFGAASLVAWIIVLLLMVSALTKPVENLGIALLPLAAISMVLEMHYPPANIIAANAPLALRGHIIISLLAYSLLTMASVQAVLLAVQDHYLRHRHPGGFIRALPPLQTMEVLLFEMIAIGFILLTIALGSGFLYLDDLFGQGLAHKTILSLVAWVVFAILLWGRHRSGWRGQLALTWTLVGFVVLMLAYFGSKFVVELLLAGG